MIVLQRLSDTRVTGIAGAGFVQRALGDSPFYNREVSRAYCAVDPEALVVVCDHEADNAPSGSRI